MSALPSQAELAARIENGDKSGRYDMAAKVEVKAFVETRLMGLATAIAGDLTEVQTDLEALVNDEILALRGIVDSNQRRIAELELSWWRRLKRWAGRTGEDLTLAVASLDEDASEIRRLPSLGEVSGVQWTGDPKCLDGTPLATHFHNGFVSRIDKSIDIRSADGKTTNCPVDDWLILSDGAVHVVQKDRVVVERPTP